jgi:superfamily II DNA or RNA helicase
MKNIRIDIGNSDSFIYGHISTKVFDLLKEDLSYKVQNCEFSEAYNTIDRKTGKRKWDGRIKLVWKTKNRIKFPTGLLSKVREIFDACGIEYDFSDSRPRKPPKNLNLSFKKGIKLRDYQEESVDKSYKLGRGIVKAATGAGKTIMAAGIMERVKTKGVIFMAMSGDLLLQAKEEFEKFLEVDGEKLEVGIVGAGQCDIKDINVATVQTICKAFDVSYEKMAGDDEPLDDKGEVKEERKAAIREMVINSNMIIFDEVQHAACETVKEIMSKAKGARYRFGLSASPWRDDNADLFIDSQFGRRIVDISASYLIRKKYLVKPYIKMVKIFTDRCAYNTYPAIYKNFIVESEKRNGLIEKFAKRHVKNGDYVLILVKQVNHGKILESKIPGSAFISGKMSAKKRKEKLDDLRDGKIKIAIATSVFDEGVDVKRLNCLIMAGSGKSSTRALQRIGRVIRLFEGKERATIYDFIDSAKYISSHSKARMKIYKTEPEFDIEIVNAGEA